MGKYAHIKQDSPTSFNLFIHFLFCGGGGGRVWSVCSNRGYKKQA